MSIRHQRYIVLLLGIAMLVLAVFLFWRYIMLIITSVPERIFKKLSL